MALKWDTDRIISICAMVVGVGSLITIGYQAALTRQAQHASVLPYLYISLGSTEQQGVRLMLQLGHRTGDRRRSARALSGTRLHIGSVRFHPDPAARHGQNGAWRRQSADGPADSGWRDDSDGRI